MLESSSEKKWVRMQLPNLKSNDELLKTSLGKRGALPSLEELNPLKYLATLDDDFPTPSPQTTVVGR